MLRYAFAALALLAMTSCSTVKLEGTGWLTEYIDGNGVIDDAQTTLEFIEPTRAGGRGGCNRYSAAVEIEGSSIRFGDAVATRMACVPALMDQETRFFVALRGVRSFRVRDEKLQLLDDSGAVKLSLSPLDKPPAGANAEPPR
jgi:heat shock protein HslJ